MFGTNDPHSLSSELPDLISFLDTKYREESVTSLTFKEFATLQVLSRFHNAAMAAS